MTRATPLFRHAFQPNVGARVFVFGVAKEGGVTHLSGGEGRLHAIGLVGIHGRGQGRIDGREGAVFVKSGIIIVAFADLGLPFPAHPSVSGVHGGKLLVDVWSSDDGLHEGRGTEFRLHGGILSTKGELEFVKKE